MFYLIRDLTWAIRHVGHIEGGTARVTLVDGEEKEEAKEAKEEMQESLVR